MRIIGACGVLLLLGACATGSAPGGRAESAARPSVNLSGYSAAFKEGYADGCSSARQSQRRNAGRYATDTDYTMGWNDGYGICGKR